MNRTNLEPDEAREAVREWAELFNHGDYFAAHEVLEGPWLRAAEPMRTLLKGLIHAAVALVHYQRGNVHGARTKHCSCVRYLRSVPAAASPIELEALLQEMDRFFAPLESLSPGASVPQRTGDWPRVDVTE